MPFSPRRSAFSALVFVLFASPLFGQVKPWDTPPFTADPKALITAAEHVEAGDFALILLLDEAEYVVDDDGGTLSKERLMFYVVAEAGVEDASEVRAPWQPWHGERPTIEGRVITRDGAVHTMDQAAIVEVPAGEEGDIFSDGRILRAPLPAVAAGSVIEYVISGRSKHPIAGAGTAVHYNFGGYASVERTRVTIDAPLASTLRIINKTGIEPRIDEKDGRRRSVYEAGRIEGQREVDAYVPYDVAIYPYLAFSTGKSWQELATNYSAIVDKQIAGNDLQKLVHNAIGSSTDRKEVATKLLAAIQKDVRYAGIEIGEGSIVPRMPKQVLANKYGDCKDKAALLVAMLRVAGFPASVALLSAGRGFDTSAELPALGHFNHAIVVVDGQPAIWVDPTDVYARAGELPLLDQGRMALIAKPETTTLVKTPEADSTANVYRENRTFFLPEDGKARVVEITEPSASSESSLRRWVIGFDAKTLRKNLEDYAKAAYVAKTMTRYETSEASDLTKPFRLTVEVPESGSGIVGNGEGSVAINLAALPQDVPNVLRDWKEPQPGQSADDAPKKRTHDFLFPQAGIREWSYRLVPPAGYVPRTLPPTETKKIGTTTFAQELRREPDNSVVATFRFDSGKRRLTAAEFQETRVAFTKFVESNTVTIGFEQLGQTKLNAGDVRGALDEFRRLTLLHPKEAQHHIEVARALLGGGLGDAAREEIRRAIAIEPKNARAHQMLGSILLNDSLGRPYRKGFDRNGAIAAFRKAKELKPDDSAIRVALIIALTFGEDGLRYSPGARLPEAVDEILAMMKDLGDEGKSTHADLTVLYSHMGRFADVRTLAPALEDEQQRDLARIIATAALEGSDAAIRELSAFEQQRKRSYASGVGQMMMQVRLYPQAAALLELATQGTPAAAEQRQMIDILRKLKRVEDLPPDDGPRGVIARFFRSLLFSDVKGILDLLPSEYARSEESPLEKMTKMDLRPPEGIPLMVFGDLVTSSFEVQQDGDDETGYRLRLRALGPAAPDDDTMGFFVRKENGRWLIRGATMGDSMTGDTVLAMAEKGELEAARKWLNWTREDTKGGTSDDPLEGQAFTALWPRSKATATADEIRLAAASLATDEFSWKKSEPILLAGREQVQSETAKAAVDLALVELYQRRDDWPKMLTATSRLVASNPDSATAFSNHIQALLRNGKAAEATVLATQRLERLPGDRESVRARALIAADAGDYTAAQQYALEVVEKLHAEPEDFTLAAWVALFTGQQLERAIEHAQHAAKSKDKDEEGANAGSLHALAGLYAATGRSVEARTALLQGLDQAHRGTLIDGDWYILGRIAENYGVDDYAIAAYRKVKPEIGTATVSELAKRRLDGLVKK
jgi:tetratricopeptide (TPR) repeat protein/transglutaminase-like putative cysteine protease